MSREILFTKSYKKDIKKYKNKPEILKEINEVINKLARDEVLEPRFSTIS